MSGLDGAAADFDGLVGIGDGIGEPAKLRPRVAAIEIELGEILARFLAGRAGSGLGLQLLDRLEIGLLAVEDRSDIGDRARRSGKSGGQRAAGCGTFGAASVGIATATLARPLAAFSAAISCRPDRRRSLGAAGFEISGPAGASHAGLNNRPADGHPAVFPGGFDAQGLRGRRRYRKDSCRNNAS